MFSFDRSDFQRVTVSAIGAFVLSAVCILGVAAPARVAADVAPVTIAAQ